MRSVLAIGGLDPTGGAGITADNRHIADRGVWPLTVATAHTVQTTDRYMGQEATPSEVFEAALDAAFATMDVDVVKTGMFGTVEQVRIVADLIDRQRARSDGTGRPRLVVDPVAAATMSDHMTGRAETMAAMHDLLVPRADVVTPDREELGLLVGRDVHDLHEAESAARGLLDAGAGMVVVTAAAALGDDLVDLVVDADGVRSLRRPRDDRGEVHGTGCAVASRIAADLALGLAPRDAARAALDAVARLRRTAVFGRAGAAQRLFAAVPVAGASEDARVDALEKATPRILDALPAAWVAECGNNIAYAPADAGHESEVAGLRQRIRLRDGVPHASPACALGASGHVARVALGAAQARGGPAAALNLRHTPEVFDAAERLGFTVGRFDRGDEPPTARSSVEWGTHSVVSGESTVDLVADDGGPGKEPMVRLIAADPEALADKLERMTALVVDGEDAGIRHKGAMPQGA